MALHRSKPDGTEGTAIAKMTYKKGQKITLEFYGCIVKNDENLKSFIQNYIKPSVDKKLFNNTKYFFYTCDAGFKEERNYIKSSIVYHRFSKPSKIKSRIVSCSPENIVTVQEHIFLLCDSRELNECKFLKEHSKKFREAQNLNTKEKIYGLSCEEKEEAEDCLKFIPLQITLKQGNLYSITTENYEKLEDAGPVLLQDKTTVVGSFERKGNNEIWISIFGKKQVNKRHVQVCSSDSSGSGELDSEQEAETRRSHPEEPINVPADQNLEAKLEERNITSPQLIPSHSSDGESEEENMTKENVNTPQSSSHDVMAGVDPKDDPKLEKPVEESEDKKKEEYEFTPPLSSEEKDSLPGEGNDKQGQEHDEFTQPPPHLKDTGLEDQTDSKISFHTSPSKERDSRPYQCNEKFSKQEINAGASGSCFHPTDSYEGHVQQQPTTKNINLASQDQQKATNEEKELLTVPLKLGPSSNYEENLPSPIQVSRSDSDDGYIISHLEEIKKNLKVCTPFHPIIFPPSYVAQNAIGKWQEIGGMLDVKHNKLDSLKCDYQSEGNAEQTYQMLVYWTQSDQNPSLEKLVVALIGTELVEVANKVSDMITESTNRGGKTVTEQLLNKITNDVKDVWKFLGRHLGIDESTIHSIKMDNRDNTREQARQMFVKWKQSNGRRATTGVLINALRDVRKSNVETSVREWEEKPSYFRSQLQPVSSVDVK